MLSTSNLSWVAFLFICQFRSHVLMFIYSHIYIYIRMHMEVDRHISPGKNDVHVEGEGSGTRCTCRQVKTWNKTDHRSAQALKALERKKSKCGRERVRHADAGRHHLAGLLASCYHLPRRENWLKWKEFAKNAVMLKWGELSTRRQYKRVSCTPARKHCLPSQTVNNKWAKDDTFLETVIANFWVYWTIFYDQYWGVLSLPT